MQPIPANNNAPGSGIPYNDIVKAISALIEIRSSVPSTAADLGAATQADWNTFMTNLTNLERTVGAFQ